MTKVELLTAAEEIALGRRVRAWIDYRDSLGDSPAGGQRVKLKRLRADGLAARNEMVERNLPLVPYLCKTYFSLPPHRRDDAEQEGNQGLIRAAEGFDPDHGIRFTTYASYWIRNYIQRFCELDRLIHVPIHAIQSGEAGKYHADGERASRIASMTPLSAAGWDAPDREDDGRDRDDVARLVRDLIRAGRISREQADCVTAFYGIGRDKELIVHTAARLRYSGIQGPSNARKRAIHLIREAVARSPELRSRVREIIGKVAI